MGSSAEKIKECPPHLCSHGYVEKRWWGDVHKGYCNRCEKWFTDKPGVFESYDEALARGAPIGPPDWS